MALNKHDFVDSKVIVLFSGEIGAKERCCADETMIEYFERRLQQTILQHSLKSHCSNYNISTVFRDLRRTFGLNIAVSSKF